MPIASPINSMKFNSSNETSGWNFTPQQQPAGIRGDLAAVQKQPLPSDLFNGGIS